MKKIFNGTIIPVFLAVVIMFTAVIFAPAQVTALKESFTETESECETGIEADSEVVTETDTETTTEVVTEYDEVNFGDVNSDGKRDASDARALLRCSAELENVTSYILTYGDYTDDDKITAADARLALCVAAGLESVECMLHGHEYKPFTVAPDCTNEGCTMGKCVRCSVTDGIKTDIVPAKGHALESYKRAPTCTAQGWVVVKCTVCGFRETSREDGKALGHNISGWVNSGNVKKRTCTRCDYTETQQIKTDKVVYLTFDDGPGPYTERLLGCLKKYDVKATFFVTNQFPGYRYLFKTMAQDGHAIGVHSLTHSWSIYLSESAYMKDFNTMHSIIKEETGIDTKIFRFPGGTNNTVSRRYSRGIMNTLAKKMDDAGYCNFDWDVDCRDTAGYNSTQIANTTINQIKNRKVSVVLMHDIKKATVDAIPTIIEYCLRNGYSFGVLDSTSPVVRFKPAN